MKLGYIAIDQWGNTYKMPGERFPRRFLLRHFDRKHADRMYVDDLDGKAVHVGWIIAGRWLSTYRVCSLY